MLCITFVGRTNKIQYMETTIRVQASFRLKADLMERLRMGAKASNRSLNNFVESVLLDAMYREPNETTKEAIAEAMNTKDKKAYDRVDELMEELMK